MTNGPSAPFVRAMQLLETVAASGQGLSLNELARRTGLPVSTTYRMAVGLVSSGYLNRAENSGVFTTGPRLWRLGQYLLSGGSIEALSGPVLHDLLDDLGEAVFITRFTGDGIELVTEVFPQGNHRSYVSPGRVFPIHATASGKVLYAMQPPDVVERALAAPLEKYRPATMTDPDDVRAHLATVREQGFATSEDELDAGVFSLACPIRIEGLGAVYALGAVGVRDHFLSNHSRDDIAGALCRRAAQLGRMLGQQLGVSGGASDSGLDDAAVALRTA